MGKMARKIRKGLNLPITGVPRPGDVPFESAKTVKTVAITGFDYNGMKPTMKVNEGDEVKIGQPLFECKKTPGVTYTSPGAGKVKAINRGKRRIFQTLVIDLDNQEQHVEFENFKEGRLNLSREEVVDLLVESGMWTALTKRPFSKIPEIDSKPFALFINAMDTHPLALDPSFVIQDYQEDFSQGVEILSKLTDGKTFVVKKKGMPLNLEQNSKIRIEEFSGMHPAGNVGTHMHFLSPVSQKRVNWSINYQDVIAVGKLFKTGKLFLERSISLGGPLAKNPRYLKTRLGANINEALEGEAKTDKNTRIVSGSVFNGRKVEAPFEFLGRYHNQVVFLEEGIQREFLGWQSPGFDKFSVKSVFLSKFMPGKKFNMNTNKNGSLRSIVPVGAYEKVMPMDILATHLLRSLAAKDTDSAQELGCLELDEEDISLFTFVCPSKIDHAPLLRENLEIIEKEG